MLLIPDNNFKSLPWLLVVIAVFWSWQLNVLALPKIETYHETCNNEQRYENQVMCENKEFGALVPYPDNCSLFLVCDCLYPTVKLCPANLWWDNKTQLCNYPQAVECIYYSIETPEPTDGTTRITPEPTSSTQKITPEPTEPPSSTAEITTETSPLITKETSSTPSNPPTSSWDSPPAPPGISDDYCRNKEDGSVHYYPYDCQAYINCTYGWPVLNYCIEDKVFNRYLGICDTPDVADCEELPIPTTTTEIPPTSTTEEDVVCGPTPEGIEEDYCVPKGNGFYEYPYNCSGYLACKNGCTDLEYCQPDKLFNNWLHICDTPDSVWCDPTPFPTTPGTTRNPTTPSVTTTPSISSTPSTSTTLPSDGSSTTEIVTSTTEITTTTPGLPSDVDPNVCRDDKDGTVFAYIGNCSEYLICKDNQVQMGHCPPNTLFNPDWLVCDEPDDVVCLGDRTTTPITTTTPTTTTERTTPTTTTTTVATTLGPDQLCDGQELGTSFPYTDDCSKYYLCLGDGKWTLAPCIYASYFDPSTGQCGPDVSPDACKASQVTTTTTTTTEATTTDRDTTTKSTTQEPITTERTTTTVAPKTGICGGRNENENIAYPNNCNKYIVCVSPIPIAFFCPDDTFFSSKLQKCIDDWAESDCEGDQSTTTVEPGFTRPPPEPTMCTNSSRDTFPYPDNCQWFIRCVDDYIYMMDVCNCGEYYDPITEKCGADVPSDACRWDYTSTTSTTSEPTTTTAVTRPPPQKGPCDNVEDGALVAYPNDCSKYIKCDRPIAVAFECDEGDEFSVELRKCVDASLANCSFTTTAKPSESTTTPKDGEGSTTPSEPPTSSSSESSTESSTELTTESTTELTTVSTTQSTTEASTESTTESTTESSTVSSTESSESPSTISTTPESSTIEPGSTTPEGTTSTKPAEGICEGKTDDSLVPYPRNCTKYIKCQYQIPVGYDCPDGLEFSPTELTCMDPELAGCSTKLTTTGLTTDASSSPVTTVSTTPEVTTELPITPKTTTTESTTIPTTTTESTTDLTTPSTTTTESTTPKTTTTESTTASITPETTTTESTTVSTTPKTTTTESTTTTDSTTPESTTTESTTVSTTPKTTTTEATTVSTTESTTTVATTTTLDPYTPNICCGQALGTLLPYPNDCGRYVVCDYPIPYAVDCDEGSIFNDELLQCTSAPNERCLFIEF
ncbi:mucin-5AC [Drosophila santomea]|uniref:mucin-5AC n=1 Tax=Drosophila santomea TaxID=129105 RepID=UPI001954EB60|nr:mucin-5AC [Drosophila santomea]